MNEDAKLEPAIITIFGITGDLSKRKLLPALYHLFKDNLLHEHTEIVGVSRRDISVDDLLGDVELCVQETEGVCDPATVKLMRSKLSMLQIDIAAQADYGHLKTALDDIEAEHGLCMNRLFYLSIPPQVYATVVRHLGEAGLNRGCQHDVAESRLLVEKPFGYDLNSAKELIADISDSFPEAAVYRIDHYLAKETAQNILTFRAKNPLFEAVWNNQHVSRIDVTALETIGAEGRTEFYDNVGALRDLVQSHLLQLLALTTLEIPPELTSPRLHKAREAVLAQVEPVPREAVVTQVVRGQYRGYRDEIGNPGSMTETFVTLGLQLDNPRWQGIPIRITTGKSMHEKRTEIVLSFGERPTSNILTFRIQPHEGIDISLQVKRPGFDNEVEATDMDFSYRRSFNDENHPDAYERVLVDAVRGDRTLFATSTEVLRAWQILQPILDSWQHDEDVLIEYEPGATVEDILSAHNS